MTRDELLALRRECVVCGGTGRARGEGSPDYSAAVWVTCRTCLGTGYVLPATDEVLGLAEEAIPMTDWQPHEQLSADSSPAEDWTEPMIDATGRANTPVREMMDDAIHRARADAAGVDAGKLVDERVAGLEAENERLRGYYMRDRLAHSAMAARLECGAARRWAAAWKRAASKFRAWQADTDAALELERRAVEVLARMGRLPKCPFGRREPDDCVWTREDAMGIPDCARCWAAWARAETPPST